MTKKYFIDPDIRKAETLPSSLYSDKVAFEDMKKKIFGNSWHFAGEDDEVRLSGAVHPMYLLEHYLDEPILKTRDSSGQLHFLSNVCTHRGNILQTHPSQQKNLICQYHGRRFALDGKFEFMPEFKDVEGFPRPCDHLHHYPHLTWGPWHFVGLNDKINFQKVLDTMNERVGFLPLHEFKLDTSRSRDYLVNAHWALYCDNYLEGFHIPFVHKDLNAVLDYGDYGQEIYDYCNLQIGYSKDAVEVFDLPEGHIDYGRNVAAYYYWVFPNMMFNFYPWGLSLNIVEPITENKTRVRFITYMYDESKIEASAGALLDKVEREDEFVVENVHRGLKSGSYQTGRFSPTREQGVHHFHGLLASFLND